MLPESPIPFLMTTQYRRFAEICNKSESRKFISLFFGKTGLGKTESALRYTNWRAVSPVLELPAAMRRLDASIVQSTAAIYTPNVGATQRMVQTDIAVLRNQKIL